MIRRLVLITSAMAALAGAAPVAAQATWYWSETAAEQTLESDYDGIINAYCYGRGYHVRTRSGLKGYHRFRCYTDMTDGSSDTGRFIVRGKYRYSFYWG